MNKFLAIVFAVAAVALFGMARQAGYITSDGASRTGRSTSQVRTASVTKTERIGCRILGVACAVACLYFVAHRDDRRR
jgi:hypothetical protein